MAFNQVSPFFGGKSVQHILDSHFSSGQPTSCWPQQSITLFTDSSYILNNHSKSELLSCFLFFFSWHGPTCSATVLVDNSTRGAQLLFFHLFWNSWQNHEAGVGWNHPKHQFFQARRVSILWFSVNQNSGYRLRNFKLEFNSELSWFKMKMSQTIIRRWQKFSYANN